MFNQVPNNGIPNGKVYGLTGELYYSDNGITYIKTSGDTLNVGWEIFGSASGSQPAEEQECPDPLFYPSVNLQTPLIVYTGEEFWVTASAYQQCGDLDSMGLRWSGSGLQNWWNLDGSGERAVRYAKLTAPETQSTMFIRVEAFDNSTPVSGTTGEWIVLEVYPSIIEPVAGFGGPTAVYESHSYWVTSSLSRRGTGSLDSMAIRWLNNGLYQSWDLNFTTASNGQLEMKNNAVRYSRVYATSSVSSQIFRVEGFDNFDTGSRTQWETVQILKVDVPEVFLEYPSTVGTNEQFWVTVRINQPGGELNSAGLRLEGTGLIEWWDLDGMGASATRRFLATAPSSVGTINLRVEAFGTADGINLLGTTGAWKTVTVVQSSAPAPTPVSPVVLAAPAVSMSGIPATAYISSSFWVTSSAEQYSGSINSMGLRQSGSGLLENWLDIEAYNPNSSSVFYTEVTAISLLEGSLSHSLLLRVEAFGTGAFTGTTGDWTTVTLLPVQPPVVTLTAPATALVKNSFWVTCSFSQPGGDLDSGGIRWNGEGQQEFWDLNGSGTSATRYYHFMSPASASVIQLRLECFGRSDVAGTTGDWVNVTITE